MKTGRDIKFVIYQVLYIFVVCVIALKGADINLEEVLARDKVVEKEIAEKLQREKDSLIALGLISKTDWDTTKKYSDADLQLILADYVKKENKEITGNITKNENNNKETEFTSNFIPPKDSKLATVQGVEFTQYTRPKLTNPYNENLEVYGDGKLVATIPPKGSAVINVNGESSFTFKVGEAKDTKPTKEKQAPKIDIQKFITDGADASLRTIQGRVGFRVTIISSYAGDLSVNISGPVKTDKVSSTQFDITLSMLSSEAAFDAWSKGKSEPYRTNFTVTVKDKYNPKHSLSQMGVFTFGKW